MTIWRSRRRGALVRPNGRRGFLAALLQAAILLGSGRLAAAMVSEPAAAKTRKSRAREGLAALFPDLAAARQVGRAYLEAYPSDADREKLLAVFDEVFSSPRPDRFRDKINARREHDFQRQDLAVVGGWVLSATEARLCALTVLL